LNRPPQPSLREGIPALLEAVAKPEARNGPEMAVGYRECSDEL